MEIRWSNISESAFEGIAVLGLLYLPGPQPAQDFGKPGFVYRRQMHNHEQTIIRNNWEVGEKLQQALDASG
jgi:hypothetical protein